METLKHTIKRKWFDMIISGEKKEEYKEIKPFWISRLCHTTPLVDYEPFLKADNGNEFFEQVEKVFHDHNFFNGAYFSEKLPNFKIKSKGIHIGTGRPEWGAVEGVNYFVIELGEVLANNETKTK